MGGRMVGDCMNTYQLVQEMASWGHRIKDSQLRKFHSYLSEMLRRNRVIMVESEHGLEAIIFYFITDDITPFSNKPFWKTPQDSPVGSIIFIDKMLCRKWTRSVRLAIQYEIESHFPFVTEAHWLRRPQNRHVILKRGGLNVHC